MITVNYGGGGYQGIGGYSLDTWDEEKKRRVGTAFGTEFILRTLRTIGVSSWDKLVGQPIFVLKTEEWGGKVLGIAPFPSGEPFIFEDLVNEFE